MHVKFPSIILILSLVCTGCTNSQGIQLADPDVYETSQVISDETKAAIVEANKLFRAYTNESLQPIALYLLDSAGQLKHNPATELKEGPEGYLLLPPKEMTSADTSLILQAYKKRLTGTAFLSLDERGNVLYYEKGKRAPWHNYQETTEMIPLDSMKNRLEYLEQNAGPGNPTITKITVGPGSAKGEKSKLAELTNLTLDTSSANIVYLKDLSEAQLLGYAMQDYELNNNTSWSYLRGALWLNFYYKYFEVNQSSESTEVKPKWLLNFSVIDAADLKLPMDFTVDTEKLVPLKDVFNKGKGYPTGRVSTEGIRRHYLVVPRKDDYYLNKWKYITLDLAKEFSLERRPFRQMVLIVNFLKSKYGDDAVKKLTAWYADSIGEPLLMTSFLKEEYGVVTNLDDLNQDYLDWISLKGG